MLLLSISYGNAAFAQPVASVTASDGIAAESGSTGEFLIRLSEPAGIDGVSIRFDLSGTADQADYNAIPSFVDFSAGQSSARVLVTPVKDEIREQLETVTITLVPGNSYALGNTTTAIVAIIDERPSRIPVVTVDALDAVAIEPEGSSTGDTGQFIVRLDQAAGDDGLTVFYQINGTAIPGNGNGAGDYLSLPGSISIPPGNVASGPIDVVPLADTEQESSETIRLTLTMSANADYIVGTSGATAEIRLNDANAPGAPGTVSTIEDIQGETQRTAGLSEAIPITATLLGENAVRLQGVSVLWQLDQAGVDAGGVLISPDAFTNGDGQARVTLQTASEPAVYTVTVTAQNDTSNIQKTFTVIAGIVDSTAPNTPEGAIGSAMDSFCPKLAATSGSLTTTQQALLARCNEIFAAARADDDEGVREALRTISPEEIAAQRNSALLIADQQTQNIVARLAALRRGTARVSLSDFTFKLGDEVLPAVVFEQFFEPGARGGSSGAIGEDPDELPLDEPFGVFVSGNISIGNKDPGENESGFEFDAWGFTSGIDYQYSDDIVFGGALGYSSVATELDNSGGTLDTEAFSLSMYAAYYKIDGLFLDGIIRYGVNEHVSARNVDYTLNGSAVQRSARGSTDGDELAMSIGIGYELSNASGLIADLFSRIDYVTATVDGFAENGAQELDLEIGKQEFDSLVLVLGGQVSQAFARQLGFVIPHVRFTWEYETQDAHAIKGQFVNDPFNTEFRFTTDEPDKDYFRVAMGATVVTVAGMAAYVQYEQIFARTNYSEYELAFGVRWAW